MLQRVPTFISTSAMLARSMRQQWDLSLACRLVLTDFLRDHDSLHASKGLHRHLLSATASWCTASSGSRLTQSQSVAQRVKSRCHAKYIDKPESLCACVCPVCQDGLCTECALCVCMKDACSASTLTHALMQGLDTAAPQIVNSTGARLTGEYEDSLGSLLFFSLQRRQGPAANAAAGSAAAGQPSLQSTAAAPGGGGSAPIAEPSSSAQQAPAADGTVGSAAFQQPSVQASAPAAVGGDSAVTAEPGSSAQQGETRACHLCLR